MSDQIISHGKYVTLNYSITDAQGEVRDPTKEELSQDAMSGAAPGALH